MLRGETVEYVRYVAPRDWRSIATNTARAVGILRRHGVSQVISTGSGIALSFFPAARLLGIPCHYIESAARSAGPSATGRVLARLPGVVASTQYASWEGGRWRQTVSVFDDFKPETRDDVVPIRRLVVTLGTMEGYGFRRLLERLLVVIPADVDVLWQTGGTDTRGLALEPRPSLPQHELVAAMANADAIVAHAGIGSALGALNSGRCPVLVPRRRSYGEHVDDHQLQIAAELSGRGLALARDADHLAWHDVEFVARQSIRRSPSPDAAEPVKDEPMETEDAPDVARTSRAVFRISPKDHVRRP